MKTSQAPAAARPLAVAGVAREGLLQRYGVWLAAAVVLIVLPWTVRAGAAVVPVRMQFGRRKGLGRPVPIGRDNVRYCGQRTLKLTSQNRRD